MPIKPAPTMVKLMARAKFVKPKTVGVTLHRDRVKTPKPKPVMFPWGSYTKDPNATNTTSDWFTFQTNLQRRIKRMRKKGSRRIIILHWDELFSKTLGHVLRKGSDKDLQSLGRILREQGFHYVVDATNRSLPDPRYVARWFRLVGGYLMVNAEGHEVEILDYPTTLSPLVKSPKMLDSMIEFGFNRAIPTGKALQSMLENPPLYGQLNTCAQTHAGQSTYVYPLVLIDQDLKLSIEDQRSLLLNTRQMAPVIYRKSLK